MADYDHGMLVSELYGLITGVPEFSAITGVSLGQQEPDPTLITLVPPACWVAFVGDNEAESDGNLVMAPKPIVFMFVAFIYIANDKQSVLLTEPSHFPLLKKVSAGVNGQESVNTGQRWAYRGQKLALVNTNRYVYAQRYTVIGVI